MGLEEMMSQIFPNFMSLPLWICCCSVTQSCPTLCNPTECSMLGTSVLHYTISWCLLSFMSIESVMLSNHLILCHPLLLLQSFPHSGADFTMSWLPEYISIYFLLQAVDNALNFTGMMSLLASSQQGHI